MTDKCDKLFSSFYVGAGIEQATVRIPSDIPAINVKYHKADGLSTATTLNIVNGVVKYTVPNDCIELNDPVRKSTVPTKSHFDGSYFTELYPRKSMGTLMFEDLWPSFGDYDFNDVVLNYRIGKFAFAKNTALDLSFKLRVRAMGGSEPYNVYILLNGVAANKINAAYLDLAVYDYANTSSKPTVTLLNPNSSESALFEIAGLRDNPNRDPRFPFLNTSKGSELSDSQLSECDIVIPFVNAIPMSSIDNSLIDIFIAKKDGNSLKEIHMAGNKPSALGGDLYKTIKQSNPNTNNCKDYYYANNNLIWAIDVPEEIPHAYENVDFLKAYPNFSKWAVNAGHNNHNWFKSPDKRLVVK